MNCRSALIGASVFAISGLLPVVQAASLDDVCNQEDSITEDTKVEIGGHFFGDCTIKVDDARLEIRGVRIAIRSYDGDDGELRIDDVTPHGGGAAELVIKYARIKTDGRLRIEEAWDGGVIFKNNWVHTGDDLRVKPIGSGDLIFKYNWGNVVGDIRLADEGLQGDIVAKFNKVNVDGDFRAQSTDGDITIRFNAVRKAVGRVQIVSASGDISLKYNLFQFRDAESDQEITVTSGGDVSVLNNSFGRSVDPVEIESTMGECESKRNRPNDVNTLACFL